MTSIPELLAGHPFFAGLAAGTLDQLAGCANNVSFAAGEHILEAESPADRVYALRSGRVSLEIATPRRGPLVIDTLGPGDLLGVSWLLPPYRWTFDARAVEATAAVAFDAACLRATCDRDPLLGYEVFKRLAGLIRDRLQSTRLQLLDLYGRDAL